MDPAPTTTAAASWTGRGDRLLVLDTDEQSLLAFDADGKLLERVRHRRLSELDYSLPIRVEPSKRAAWVGDRTGVLKVGKRKVSKEMGGTFGADKIFFGDWTLVDGELVAYADVAEDKENWSQGFVRVGRKGVERLLDLPLEKNGEYLSYHSFYRRPYVARLGDEVFILRYTRPSSVSKVVDGGLDVIWQAEDETEEHGYFSLHAWDDALFLLSRIEVEVEVEDEPTAPTLESGSGSPGIELESVEKVKTESRWELVRLDPRQGKVTWRRPLPTSNRPVLAPGPDAWALIDGSALRPLNEEPKPTYLTFLPSKSFGPEAPADLCAGSQAVGTVQTLPVAP